VGVLLVFALLVVPGTAAIIAGIKSISRRLLFGWVFRRCVCVAGMAISFIADLPPGATIVSLFGAALLAMGAYSSVVKRPS